MPDMSRSVFCYKYETRKCVKTVQDKEHCFTKVVIAVNSMVLDSAEYSRSGCLYPDQTVIFTLFIELFFFKKRCRVEMLLTKFKFRSVVNLFLKMLTPF